MTNKKVTRRALLMSVTSLLICISMLLGTTFAWFTDEVTSGVNKIVAGNLDVELLHTNANGENETVVNTMEKLFKRDINGNDLLWEPEVISFEKFTVNNVGTLALKYQMTLNNVGYNTLEGNSLLDVIKVAIADSAPADRAAAQALFAAGQTYYSLNELVNSPITLSGTNDGKLAAADSTGTDDTEEFALVLYWPQSDSDNNWNVQNGKVTSDGTPLYIDLGITLVATQDTVEADSFDKYYDDNATQPADSYATQRVSYSKTLTATSNPQTVVAQQPTTLSAAATPASSSGNTTVTFEADALTAEQNAVLTVDTKNVLAANAANGTFTFTSGANETKNSAVASIDLTLKVGENTVSTFNDKNATVNTYITKGLTSVLVKYNTVSTDDVAFKSGVAASEVNTDTPATELSTANYNPKTGYLSFVTNHFSEYVVYDNVVAYNATSDKVYSDLQDAIDEAKSGAEIVLLKDVTLDSVGGQDTSGKQFALMIKNSLVLDGNNHTITTNVAGLRAVVGVQGTNENEISVAFVDVTIDSGSKCSKAIETRGGISSLTIDNSILSTDNYSSGSFDDYRQVLTIGGYDNEPTIVNVSGSTVKTSESGNVYYAVVIWNPVKMTIKDSDILGWANLYFKEGSDGSNVKISGGSMTSVGRSGSSNSFGLITFESGKNNINISNTDISVSTTATDSYQSLVTFSPWYGPNTGNTVSVTGGTVALTGDHAQYYDEKGGENKLAITSAAIDGEANKSYSYTSPETEVAYLYYNSSNAKICDGLFVMSDLLAANTSSSNHYFCNGEWLELTKDVTLSASATLDMRATKIGTFGLVLGDYNLTLAEGVTLTIPSGVTIKTDKQLNNIFSAPEGFSVTQTEVEGGYTYTVTDAEQSGE